MQPLVPLVFHNLPSLYPLHLEEMIFYTCFHFLTVPNAPSKTMLEYRCKKDMLIPLMRSTRGSNSDRTVTTLRYKPLRYATLTCHKPLHNTRARGRSRRGTLSKRWRRSLLIHAETRDFHSRRGIGARTIAWGRCTPLTIVYQFGIKISGFTPSFEALGRLTLGAHAQRGYCLCVCFSAALICN